MFRSAISRGAYYRQSDRCAVSAGSLSDPRTGNRADRPADYSSGGGVVVIAAVCHGGANRRARNSTGYGASGRIAAGMVAIGIIIAGGITDGVCVAAVRISVGIRRVRIAVISWVAGVRVIGAIIARVEAEAQSPAAAPPAVPVAAAAVPAASAAVPATIPAAS